MSLLRVLLAMAALHDEVWGDGMQQDAQEFLHGLLNQLQVTNARITARCRSHYSQLRSHMRVCRHIEIAPYKIWDLIQTPVMTLTTVRPT